MKQKKALTDFTKSSLPHNRWQVFADCFKLNWGTLLRLGLILLLFALPLLLVSFYFDLEGATYYQEWQSGTLTEEAYLLNLYGLQFSKSIVNVLCYCIFAIGLSGVVRVLRQLIWAEPVFFKEDFWTGVRSNCGVYIFCAVMIGICGIYNAFVQSTFTDITLWTSFPFGIEISVIVPTILYVASQTIVYQNKLGAMIKNGFFFYIRTFPVTILFTALFALMFAVEFLSSMLVKYVLLLVLFLVYMPLVTMGWMLCSFSAFDRLVNQEHYPEIYRKGIFDDE